MFYVCKGDLLHEQFVQARFLHDGLLQNKECALAHSRGAFFTLQESNFL